MLMMWRVAQALEEAEKAIKSCKASAKGELLP
jgi:hypothetical protein